MAAKDSKETADERKNGDSGWVVLQHPGCH